jgi:succinoglycan biosynthesis protein ExoO
MMSLLPPHNAPDVSIIIAAWNRGEAIRTTIASALASKNVTLEVIAVDDASTDDTYEQLLKMAQEDNRLHCDRLAVNAGPSGARNRAIEMARGEFIAVVDADDVITPTRLAHMLEWARRNRTDIVVDALVEVDAHHKPISPKPFLRANRFRSAQAINLADWVHFNTPARGRDMIGYLKPLIRRSVLTSSGLRYDPALRNSEDYDLVARLLASGATMIYTPEPGYLYQRSPHTISHRLTSRQTKGWIEAHQRFEMRYADRLDPEARRTLAARRRALKDADLFVTSVEAIESGQIGSLPRLFLSAPLSMPFSAGALGRIALGKLIGRRLV